MSMSKETADSLNELEHDLAEFFAKQNATKLTAADLNRRSPFRLNEKTILFLNALHQKFEPRRREMVLYRSNSIEDFCPRTVHIRDGGWTCSKSEEDEEVRAPPMGFGLVGGFYTKNRNVSCVADFEDYCPPTWTNLMLAQQDLININSGKFPFKNWGIGYKREMGAKLAIAPRALHRVETHMFGMSAALFDFGVYLANNWSWCRGRSEYPRFSFVKLEHGDESQWWAEVMDFSEKYLDMPEGTIKCSVTIEGRNAEYQLNEIIYHLKDRITNVSMNKNNYLCVRGDEKDLDYTIQLIKDTCKKRNVTFLNASFEEKMFKVSTDGVKESIRVMLKEVEKWISGKPADLSLIKVNMRNLYIFNKENKVFDENFTTNMVNEEVGKLTHDNDHDNIFLEQACEMVKYFAHDSYIFRSSLVDSELDAKLLVNESQYKI